MAPRPRLGTLLRLEPGRLLTRQGAVGRELFLIDSGRVTVIRDGLEVASLGPGDVVGEMAMLQQGGLRTATVRADTTVRVVVYDRRELATLLDRTPGLEDRWRELAVSRAA